MKKLIPMILSAALLLSACAVPNNTPDVPNEPSLPVQGTEDIPETPTESDEPELPQEEELPPPPPPPDPREEMVNAILSSMTLEEKVGQLFFVRCPSADQAEKIARYHLGGYLLFTRDFKNEAGDWLTEEEFLRKIASYQEMSAIPLLIGVDEEGGTVARASRNPNLFPAKRKSPGSIYRSGGMEAVLADTLAVNSRLLELGINVNFAPVADVSQNAGDFIYDRTLGEDTATTAAYIAAVVEQMNTCAVNGETRPIGSVLKHFPGYGNNVDTHTGIAVDTRPYETFVNADFLPFSAGIEAGAGAVLVSHNIITALDADLPASLSASVISVLRNELGFDGVILTDDLAMDAVKQYADNGEAAVLALKAGNSMILTTDFETQIPQVLSAIERGELTEELINSAVRHVLFWKYDLGLIQGEHYD